MTMLLRKLYKNGQILIPKKITQILGIENGFPLYIYIIDDVIIIEQDNKDKHLNQITLSNGNITIPSELRKLLKLDSGSLLKMEVNADNKIYLRKTS